MATRRNVKVYGESGWTVRTTQGAGQSSVRFHTRGNRRRGIVRTDTSISQARHAARKVYCRMYEQEEKDIAKAVSVLEKFTP